MDIYGDALTVFAELREIAQLCHTEVAETSDPGRAKDAFVTFKTFFTGTMIEEAARLYGDGSSEDILAS